jgi:hypothetical protein
MTAIRRKQWKVQQIRLEGKATLFENFGRRYSLLPDTAIATLASASLQKEHVSGPIIAAHSVIERKQGPNGHSLVSPEKYETLQVIQNR